MNQNVLWVVSRYSACDSVPGRNGSTPTERLNAVDARSSGRSSGGSCGLDSASTFRGSVSGREFPVEVRLAGTLRRYLLQPAPTSPRLLEPLNP